MPNVSYPKSLEEALLFDETDPISDARTKFSLPEQTVYLVGHSLGPAPRSALSALHDSAETDWRIGMVSSWNAANWIDMPRVLGSRIARLIGAQDDEVVVCDSVSVNLFKLVGALTQRRESNVRVIVEDCEFPTDQYILKGLADLTGARLQKAKRNAGVSMLQDGDILVRSLVDYRTAEVSDVQQMEQTAQDKGAAIVWDLSHATGVLDLKLREHGAKYAVGCTYKYLNGGPGAPAFIYVRDDCVDDLQTPLPGWLGHSEPFAFSNTYQAAEGVQRFVAGTPPILSMSALNGALDAFEGVNLSDLESKAQRLGDMCLHAFSRLGLPSPSPTIGMRRGGHVSLIHEDGYAVSQALAKRGYKTDFRTPDTIRFGLSPLFLKYSEVWSALAALSEILETKQYLEPEFSVRQKVT